MPLNLYHLLIYNQKINEGSKSGASDITFVYKHKKTNLDIDPCSTDSTEQKDKPILYFCSSKYFRNDTKKE